MRFYLLVLLVFLVGCRLSESTCRRFAENMCEYGAEGVGNCVPNTIEYHTAICLKTSDSGSQKWMQCRADANDKRDWMRCEP